MSRTRLRLGAAALAATLTSTLVATLATPATSAPVPPENDELLVVGTYNIRSDRSLEQFRAGIDPFKDRVHVAGLQEIGANDKNQLLKDDHDWGYLRPPEVQQNPVIWRRDLFDFVGTPSSSRFYRLAGTRWIEAKGGGLMKKRATWATVVRLRHRATGTPISVVNVHLMNGSLKRGRPHPDRPRRFDLYADQLRRTRTIARSEQSDGRTVYVTGDFNSDYQSDERTRHRKLPFRRFKRVGYVSMWHGEDLGRRRGTFNRSHLDGVWARDRAVSAVAVQDIDVSDHQPAIATYRLERQPGYQPTIGSFGFGDERLTDWECHKPWHIRKQGTMRFELTGDTRHGYVRIDLGGTATHGKDYLVHDDAVHDSDFTNDYIEVEILPDTMPEDDETVILRLVDPVNARVAGAGEATAVIRDDDPAPENWWNTPAGMTCTGR